MQRTCCAELKDLLFYLLYCCSLLFFLIYYNCPYSWTYFLSFYVYMLHIPPAIVNYFLLISILYVGYDWSAKLLNKKNNPRWPVLMCSHQRVWKFSTYFTLTLIVHTKWYALKLYLIDNTYKLRCRVWF